MWEVCRTDLRILFGKYFRKGYQFPRPFKINFFLWWKMIHPNDECVDIVYRLLLMMGNHIFVISAEVHSASAYFHVVAFSCFKNVECGTAFYVLYIFILFFFELFSLLQFAIIIFIIWGKKFFEGKERGNETVSLTAWTNFAEKWFHNQ